MPSECNLNNEQITSKLFVSLVDLLQLVAELSVQVEEEVARPCRVCQVAKARSASRRARFWHHQVGTHVAC